MSWTSPYTGVNLEFELIFTEAYFTQYLEWMTWRCFIVSKLSPGGTNSEGGKIIIVITLKFTNKWKLYVYLNFANKGRWHWLGLLSWVCSHHYHISVWSPTATQAKRCFSTVCIISRAICVIKEVQTKMENDIGPILRWLFSSDSFQILQTGILNIAHLVLDMHTFWQCI